MSSTVQRGCVWWWVSSVAVLPAGCGDGDFARGFQYPDTRRDIVSVNTFYTTKPWLNFERPPRDIPGGFKFTLYLRGADSAQGVFGDGTIHIDMYRVDDDDAPDGTKRTHVRRWSFDTEQAHPYRAKREVRFGRAYGFRLDWGGSNVLGHEIMIIASFERFDGRIIYSQPKYLKVPPKV